MPLVQYVLVDNLKWNEKTLKIKNVKVTSGDLFFFKIIIRLFLAQSCVYEMTLKL